jgi:hypothetical protein
MVEACRTDPKLPSTCFDLDNLTNLGTYVVLARVKVELG